MIRTPLTLITLLALAGCDEPTIITHVDRLSHMSQGDLLTMQGAKGIPVEFHGSPFRDTPATTLANAMRPPSGSAQGVRFAAATPGEGHNWRLVLHFNPQDGIPNAFHDCKLTSEAQTAGPSAESFSVNATFCKGTEWQAHGFMKVLEIEDGDVEAFSRVMRQLFLSILPKNTDPDR